MVSICVPAYNGEAFLRQCLASARRQTFTDFELLVVDDASRDTTMTIIGELARREPRLRIHRNPRRLGLVGNWNRCLALSRSTWVKFLFQDDMLDPLCLERMLAAAGPGDMLVASRRRIRFEPGVAVSVKAEYRADSREHAISRRFPGLTRVPAKDFAALLVHQPGRNCIGEPTAVLVRRRAFERYGNFNGDLAMLCDWELCARVAVNTGLRYIDEPLATFRVHNKSESEAYRKTSRFRAEILDELLIRHELATASVYAPVRRAARRWKPPVDLREALATAVHQARALVRHYPGAPAAWRRLLKRTPRLAALAAQPAPPPLPATPLLRRAALDLLAQANS